MDFSKVDNKLLVASAVFHAKSERKRMHIVLLHIAEIERRGIYAELGYSNMCKFVAEVLGCGSKPAYERWGAAKLLQQVPVLSEQLEDGTINLTQISQVRRCLIQDKKSGKTIPTHKVAQVFEQIAAKNTFETKQILSNVFDRPVENHEKIEPQKDGTSRFTTSFSVEMLQALEILKALNSNQQLSGNVEDILLPLVLKEIARIKGTHQSQKSDLKQSCDGGDILNNNLGHRDQVFKLDQNVKSTMDVRSRNSSYEDLQEEVMLRNCGVTLKRKPIANRVWQFVMQKAQYQCEFTNAETGKKCSETHYLEVDHKIPIALGGTNRSSNLQVLCRTHNQLSAKKMGLIKPEYEKCI